MGGYAGSNQTSEGASDREEFEIYLQLTATRRHATIAAKRHAVA